MTVGTGGGGGGGQGGGGPGPPLFRDTCIKKFNGEKTIE